MAKVSRPEPEADLSSGAEVGSTTAIKALFLPGMIPPLKGYFTSANDNVALVAANDNTVVAARLAA